MKTTHISCHVNPVSFIFVMINLEARSRLNRQIGIDFNTVHRKTSNDVLTSRIVGGIGTQEKQKHSLAAPKTTNNWK